MLGSAAGVAVATGTAAQAASGDCTTTGTTVTCTQTGAGTYSFTVPQGVTSLDVVAVGAAGGAGAPVANPVSPGGPGASVEDAAVPVSTYQGQALTVIVGGVGGNGTSGFGTAMGGAGGRPGGGGAGGDPNGSRFLLAGNGGVAASPGCWIRPGPPRW
jgi:hypothetical protein